MSSEECRNAGRSFLVSWVPQRLVFGIVILLAAAWPALAGEAARHFPARWRDAGEDEAKRQAVLEALADDGGEDAAKILVDVVSFPDATGATADHAISCLARLEGKPGDAWIRKEIERGKHWPDRALLVRAVGRRGSEAARAALIAALGDRSWQVQAAAIEALRRHAAPETVEALLAGWERLDPKEDHAGRLAGDYRDTLLVITGKDFQTVHDAGGWWSENKGGWVPKRSAEPIEEREGVTQERTPKLFYDVTSSRVLFVIDTSASMRVGTGVQKDPKKAPTGLTRFEVMRRALRRVIEDLPPGASFGLVTFGDKVASWKPRLLVASESHKKQALRYVDALQPDGQTNSHGALEAAFKVPDADTMYFLSDGYPTVGKMDFNAIISDVKRWNATRNVRIHTIAFVAGDGKPIGVFEGDKSLPKEFMRRLAQENGGRYKLVE